MTSTCPKCSKPLAVGRPKCFHCGAVLAATTPCASCGRPLARTATRCVYCGTGAGTDAEAEAATKPAAKPVVLLPVPQADGIAQIQELRRRAEAAAIANIVGRDGTNAEAKRRFELADQLDADGRLEEALTAYDEALALDPGFSSAWTDKGHVLFKLGRFNEGLACHERAVALAPQLMTAWSNKAACLVELGRPAEALEAAVRATGLAPRSPAPWMNRARCETILGRTAEAIASYEHVSTLGLDPGTLAAVRERLVALRGGPPAGGAKTVAEWIAEGARLGIANDVAGSLRALDQALELDKSAWQAWLNKAVTMAKEGLLLDALAYAEHAVAVAPPGTTQALELRVRVERSLGATPPHARRRLAFPPGRFGPSMMARAGEAGEDAAFAIIALRESIARGLIAGAETIGAVSYYVLVPHASHGVPPEVLVDVLTADGSIFVFRRTSERVMPDDALLPEELAAFESLLAHQRSSRVVIGGSAPWGPRVLRAVADANARVALQRGAGARLVLEVLGGPRGLQRTE